MKSNVKDNLLGSSSEESASEDDEEAWKLTEDGDKSLFETLSQVKSEDPKIYERIIVKDNHRQSQTPLWLYQSQYQRLHDLLESSSEESASEDDEEAWKLTEDVEKSFFKTLSQIKSKDPKIYEKNIDFFKDVPIPQEKPKEKTKSTPLTLREYERKIIVEKGGELSDEEPLQQTVADVPLSYVEEQKAIKNSIKAFIQSDSEYESEAEWGGLFRKRRKSKKEEEKEEVDYKEWLKGQKSEVPDKEVAEEMKPLRDFWTNPDLDKEDQFLRDYILNKKFLETDDKGDSEVDLDKLHNESENEDNAEKKYIHRFDETDLEFIKRYPRIMENSVRRKDDARSRKRQEIKARKLKEKEVKRTEIKKKQKLKKREIEEKIEELKKLTGNDKLAFENVLENDFDINEHEKAMERLFNDEFYSQDDPNFIHDHPANSEDVWDEEVEVDGKGADEGNDEEPHCEDPEFNMDCDYGSNIQKPREKTSRSRRRKDKHRRTTVSEAVKREKPVFNPEIHKTFQEYVDQYYSIDCEDFIGDLPCRFKYRKTVPNSYGLTIDEILAADSKELERWCSIKRIQQLKPQYKEKCDAEVFNRRAANEKLKRKILPSLYKKSDEEKCPDDEKKVMIQSDNETINNNFSTEVIDKSRENNSKFKSAKGNNIGNLMTKSKKSAFPSDSILNSTKEGNINGNRKRKFDTFETRKAKKSKISEQGEKKNFEKNNTKIKKKKNEFTVQKKSNEKSSLLEMSDARLQAYGIKPKKFKNKLKYSKENKSQNQSGTRKDKNVPMVKKKKKTLCKQSSGNNALLNNRHRGKNNEKSAKTN